jgi:serine/threonine protein kinase
LTYYFNLFLASPRKLKRDQEVHTKLADYGISRPTLPTGAKGFGGTEGFMAPEIVRYNGEEEYTEKVDCFSFGMFIYELLTLQQPFSGYETVKELILEGGRPPLTSRELVYPTYILDLMVVCWAQQPRQRPSASQIVSIASAPEFLHLMDVVSLDQGACCAATLARSMTSEKTFELWLANSSGFSDKSQLHVVEVVDDLNHVGWQEDTVIKSSDKIDGITSMCLVTPNNVWIGDNAGYVHGFDLATYALLFSYKMEPDVQEEPSPVRSIYFLEDIKRVCVAMHNGRLFLCDAEVIPTSQSGNKIYIFFYIRIGKVGQTLFQCWKFTFL